MMDAVMQFLCAALPWIMVGLLLAIFFARSANRKKKQDEKPADNYGTEGMCLGICFGTAIGTSLGNNTGIGISMGMLIGLAIGSSIPKKDRGESDDQK